MITILLATYNGEEYLREQLESIKKQTYTDWKIIAGDDGSRDKTVEILREFACKFPDRIDYIENVPPTGSAKKNFAKLMSMAEESDYIMCCDQDDMWKSYKLEESMKKMNELEKRYGKAVPLLIHGDVEVVDEEEKVISDSMFKLSGIPPVSTVSKLMVQNNVTGCTMFMNQALLKKVLKSLDRDEVIMHDYIVALYARVFGYTDVIELPLLSYRQHGDNSVGAKNSKSIGYLLKRFSDGKNNYKKAMSESRRQIKMFAEVYKEEFVLNQKSEEYKLLCEYSELGDRNHLSRVLFYIKNKAWKKGVIRKIMQIFWG